MGKQLKTSTGFIDLSLTLQALVRSIDFIRQNGDDEDQDCIPYLLGLHDVINDTINDVDEVTIQ